MERPILFSGPMVRAILDGSKTQTRRVMKPQPKQSWMEWLIENNGGSSRYFDEDGYAAMHIYTERGDYREDGECPYGKPGDLLWVRETWRRAENGVADGIVYRADNLLRWFDGSDMRVNEMSKALPRDGKWRPSIFMPRWASRITLRITDVRVEQLQDISDNDALAEGITPVFDDGIWSHNGHVLPRDGFTDLWNSINGKAYPWVSNPWVWAVSFERVKGGA